MRKFKGKVFKKARGKSYVVVNHTRGGGTINHVVVADNETSLDALDIAENKRLADAMKKKEVWSNTEFVGEDLEVMEVD